MNYPWSGLESIEFYSLRSPWITEQIKGNYSQLWTYVYRDFESKRCGEEDKMKSISLLFVSLMVFLSGCEFNSMYQEDPHTELYTAEEVVSSLAESGINLTISEESHVSEGLQIEGLQPQVFTSELQSQVFIYVFDTIGERAEAQRNLEWSASDSPWRYTSEVRTLGLPLSARNILIQYAFSAKVPDPSLYYEEINTLDETVFSKLNKGETLVLRGEGEFWKGKVTVKYYEHWYEVESELEGITKSEVDKQGNGCFEMTYIGEDLDTLSEVAYEYVMGSNRSGISGRRMKGNKITGCNSASHGLDTNHNIEMRWNGKSERIEFK
jgi:hypothetical protein